MVDTFTVMGMVLSSMPIGEYDKRIVIYTKEMGKISAFVRGARRANSPYLASTQAMSFGEFTLYRGRNSYTVNSAKISDYFFEKMHDPDVLYTGMYFLELADYYGKEDLPSPETLALLYLAMKNLSEGKIERELIRCIFELKMMVINGEYPDFFSCKLCGKKEELVFFDEAKEGVICSDCYGTVSEQKRLKKSTLYALQYIVSSPIGKLFSFTVNDDILEQLKTIINAYIAKRVDKHFNSLDFL